MARIAIASSTLIVHKMFQTRIAFIYLVKAYDIFDGDQL